MQEPCLTPWWMKKQQKHFLCRLSCSLLMSAFLISLQDFFLFTVFVMLIEFNITHSWTGFLLDRSEKKLNGVMLNIQAEFCCTLQSQRSFCEFPFRLYVLYTMILKQLYFFPPAPSHFHNFHYLSEGRRSALAGEMGAYLLTITHHPQSVEVNEINL